MPDLARITVSGAPEGFDARLLLEEAERSGGCVVHVARDDKRMAALREALADGGMIPFNGDAFNQERLGFSARYQVRSILPAFSMVRARLVVLCLRTGRRGLVIAAAARSGIDGAEVLLTRRSMHMRNHRGEISFPGGRLDPGETPIETALREAHEEVGLDPAKVLRLGELNEIESPTGFRITPCVGAVPYPVETEPDPGAAEEPPVGLPPLPVWIRPFSVFGPSVGRSQRLHASSASRSEIDFAAAPRSRKLLLTIVIPNLSAIRRVHSSSHQ